MNTEQLGSFISFFLDRSPLIKSLSKIEKSFVNGVLSSAVPSELGSYQSPPDLTRFCDPDFGLLLLYSCVRVYMILSSSFLFYIDGDLQ